MSPLPDEIGPLQCILRRDNKGVNKLSPKYYLALVDENNNNIQMLSANKIQSITCNMQIKIDSQYVSFIAQEGETLLGRLRANNGNTVFYIFDWGVNPKDAKGASFKK